jgi:hypothetical protein
MTHALISVRVHVLIYPPVGLYQHDVKEKELATELAAAVEVGLRPSFFSS